MFHNLLVVGGAYSNQLYFFSYESCHLLLVYSLAPDVEATALAFLNGFSLLAVATNNNYVLFFRFSHQQNLQLTLVGYVNLSHDQQ